MLFLQKKIKYRDEFYDETIGRFVYMFKELIILSQFKIVFASCL